ncbi:MAG: DUF6067 family protein, partial [Planctomycetota bacterium]|nr:DUF6067 family protein [Planctomycetota bacterium]
ELKIPYSQLIGFQKPEPGVTWEMAFMNQQLTPVRRMITWSQAWSFKSKGYESLTMGKLRFVDGLAVRQKRIGAIKQRDAQEPVMGNEFILHNSGKQASRVSVRTSVFRSSEKRPDTSETFLSLWDMVRHMDRTGEKMIEDPKMAIQAFRSRADLVKEMNDRYQFIRTEDYQLGIAPGKNSYSLFRETLEHGEYLVMSEMRDVATGDLVYSNIMPCAYFPGFSIAVHPFYLRHQKIRAELDLSSFDESIQNDSIEVVLVDRKGATLDRALLTKLTNYRKVKAYLDTSKVEEETDFIIKASLHGPGGKVKHQEQVKIHRPARPDWFGNSIGKSKVVPKPFKPLRKVNDTTIELYERTIRIGPSGLPGSIVSRGTELLARPIQFIMKVGGEILPQDFRIESKGLSGRDARWVSTSQGPLLTKVTTELAYDGMLRFDVSLQPRQESVTVEQFKLSVPVKKEWSRYFAHHATGTRLNSNSTACKAGFLSRWFKEYEDGMPFTFAFMLSAEDRGIQWFCPSDRHWSNEDERKKIAIRQDEDAITLVISFVDKPKKLEGLTEYSFGLMATPVRPCNPDNPVDLISAPGPNYLIGIKDEKKLALNYAMLKSVQEQGAIGVGDYLNKQLFGVPRFYGKKQEKEFAEALKTVHAHHLKYVPYANWGLHSGLPFFKAFGYEMLLEPFRDISFSCFLQIMASTFPDWYLHTLKHSRDVLKIDGNYMDSTQYPRLAFNELEGMAWRDEQGRLHGTYDIWAQREFAERLYIFWHHETDPPGIIGSHTSQVPLYFLAPFTDYLSSGEFHIAGKTLEEQCPLDTFLMFYCTWPHGVTTHRHWWNWYKKPLLRNQVWTMNMLHDVLMKNSGGNIHYYRNTIGYARRAKPYVRIRQVRKIFNGSRFEPYWNQRLVRFEPSGPKASVWLNDAGKAALIFVANIPNRDYSGTMSIDATALPAGTSPNVYDAMLDRELDSVQQPVRLKIEPMRYRVVTVGRRIPLPQGARIVSDDDQTSTAARTRPAFIGSYSVPEKQFETDEHTLLLSNFNGSIRGTGSLGQFDGKTKGKPVYGAGRFGQAFRSEVDEEEIVYFNLGEYRPGETGTLEFWFKYIQTVPPAKPIRFTKLIGLKKSNAQACFFNFYRDEKYNAYMVQPHFWLRGDKSKEAYAGLNKTHLRFKDWNHIGITWKKKTCRIFANGKIVSAFELPEPIGFYFGPQLTIGSAYPTGGAVDCLFDDFRLSDVARY